MKRIEYLLALSIVIGCMSNFALGAEPRMCTITLDEVQNGSISIQPPLPENKTVPAGTELTISATPATDYALDCLYYIGTGNQGRMYYENASSPWKITIDGNWHIGASFIEQKAVEGFTVKNDIVFAQPGVKKLKYDVFTPNGAKNLPCIIIIHGGAWSVNNEDVMRGLARELVRGGKYVPVSVDYRWIANGDGDKTPVTMANIIEDVYGAIIHIQEHANEYGVDPTRLAVTGDSAGGHLAAAVINMADQIGDQGFGVKSGVYQFKPTYMPKDKSIDQVRKEVVSALKAAAPSYGVFSEQALSFWVRLGGETLKAVTPLSNIPNIKNRAVPQFLLRGTSDMLIRNEEVQTYADALKAAGQRAEYVQVPGAAHAFLDWKPDARTKATFYRYGVQNAAKMKEFFDSIFYPSRVSP